MIQQFKNLNLSYLTVLSILIMLAAGCGKSDKNKESGDPQNNIITEESTEDSMAKNTPLAFKDKNGNSVTLDSLKGKVVFINFWAVWCPPCIQEMPSINKLRQSFKENDKIEFLMVDVDSNIGKAAAFMENRNFDLPVYVAEGNIPSEYLGESIPVTVILDKNGNIAQRLEGSHDYADPMIINVLQNLIGDDKK